jgi:glycosyltransferase involved in cell wall biosynthesis
MRIGYDIRPFLREETGVGVYLKNLLAALAALDTEDEFFLFSASWKDRFDEAKLPPLRRRRFLDRRWPVRAVNFMWQDLRRPTLDRVFGTRLDLTHSATPLPLPTRGRTIVTVCDLFFLEDPARADREARRKFLRKTAGALRRADGIVTISRFSRQGIEERFGISGDKILVTYLGLSDVFRRPRDPARGTALRRELGLSEPFLLFVGASEPRKNLPVLIEALAVLRDRGRPVPLVLVGRPGGDQAAVEEAVRRRRLERLVRLAGYRPDEDVCALYDEAAVLVFPSLAEGFGLPLLEAMARGLPAAVSGVGALPEIGDEAAVYFNPGQAESVAEAVLMVLDDEGLRRKMRSRGLQRAAAFDWRTTAAQTLEFYRRIAGTR